MKKPRILVLTGAPPYPLVTGAKIRTFNLLAALAGEFDIELLTMLPDEREITVLDKIRDAGITCHYLIEKRLDNRNQKAIDALCSYMLSEPYLTRHYTIKRYRRLLDSLLASGQYDVIHCDSISMTGNLHGLGKGCLILTQHNIEHIIWAGYVDHAHGFIDKMFYRNQYRKVRRLEENLRDVYGHIVTVSENDKETLAAAYPRDDIVVVENGVAPAAYRAPASAGERVGIMFSGSLDWHANVDGLIWFMQEVFDHLRKKAPDASITIVGRRPHRTLKAALGDKPGINLQADVPEVQPFLWKARVMMVPLRIGGGSRLKILEAMAAGLPVVSTGKGAEGLAIRHNEHLIIEDDPVRFADALVQILVDDTLFNRLSTAGMELVKSRYSWEQVARPQAELWRRLAHV
jgi:glycosyltransferase involved in cell wall biosynthesis